MALTEAIGRSAMLGRKWRRKTKWQADRRRDEARRLDANPLNESCSSIEPYLEGCAGPLADSLVQRLSLRKIQIESQYDFIGVLAGDSDRGRFAEVLVED